MARRNGESHIGRNLAIGTGAALASVALSYGAWRWWGREVKPNFDLRWDEDAVAIGPQEARTAYISPLVGHRQGRGYKGQFAIVAADLEAFDGHVAKYGGRPAVAVRGQETSGWSMAPAANGRGFTEIGDQEEPGSKRVLAMGLGSNALQRILLGVVAGEDRGFVPFDTEVMDVVSSRELRRRYPDVPVAAAPPDSVLAPPAAPLL